MTIFEIDNDILRNLEVQRCLGCKKWTKNDSDLIPSAQSFILMVVFSELKKNNRWPFLGRNGQFWVKNCQFLGQFGHLCIQNIKIKVNMPSGEELEGWEGACGISCQKIYNIGWKLWPQHQKNLLKIWFKDRNSGCILTKKTFYPLQTIIFISDIVF